MTDGFSIAYMLDKLPMIMKVVPLTLFIAITAMICGCLFGFVLAAVRLYNIPLLSQLAACYISFIRGTPLLVQMYVIFYGTPKLFAYVNGTLGAELLPTAIAPLVFALVIFSMNTSAYQSEVWYAALRSIDLSQIEAAQSVGMTIPQALRRILIPQAMVNALPNLGNIFINLVKGTSLAFAIQIVDIMAVAKIQAGNDYRYLEMYTAVSLVYWALCFGFERWFLLLENYFGRYKQKAVI